MRFLHDVPVQTRLRVQTQRRYHSCFGQMSTRLNFSTFLLSNL